MPGFDGTGPIGYGPLTGRGTGYCVCGVRRSGYGNRAWFGFRRHFRPYPFPIGYPPYTTDHVGKDVEKEMLLEQKENLENWLNSINKQLEEIDKDKDKDKDK